MLTSVDIGLGPCIPRNRAEVLQGEGVVYHSLSVFNSLFNTDKKIRFPFGLHANTVTVVVVGFSGYA